MPSHPTHGGIFGSIGPTGVARSGRRIRRIWKGQYIDPSAVLGIHDDTGTFERASNEGFDATLAGPPNVGQTHALRIGAQIGQEVALDPELAAGVPMIPVLDPTDPVRCREQLEAILAVDAFPRRPHPGVDAMTVSVPDAPEPPLTCRCYTPRTAAQTPMPAILWCHGGGFIYGSAALEEEDCMQLAESVQALVVAVDYRLAPEHPYPAAVEDCFATLKWMARENASLGIDPGRIALAGVSAGAGLAAAVTLMTRDRGGPQPIYQQLINPILDDRMTTRSMKTFISSPVFDRSTVELIWRYYLGPEAGEVDYYAAPARATDLRSLPPAFIEVSELDPLRDEGLDYALGLLDAGVSVELHAFPGTFHGSDAIRTAAVTQRAMHERTAALRLALEVTVARTRGHSR
jgi:acetyl esterase